MEEITYEDIRKEIEGIYKKLNYLYGKANTKSKQRRLITTIGALDEICCEDCLDFDIDNSHLIKKYIWKVNSLITMMMLIIILTY